MPSTYRLQTNASEYHVFREIDIPSIRQKKISLMIIDDDRRDIAITTELLSLSCFRFNIVAYTNPTEAMEYLGSTEFLPELILLDLTMPSLNGKLTLEKIKGLAQSRAIPVIIHSSMYNMDNIIHTSRLEAHAFFKKPLDIDAFEDYILHGIHG